MTRHQPARGRLIPVIFFSFLAGGFAGWWLHASYPTPRSQGATAAGEAMEPGAADAVRASRTLPAPGPDLRLSLPIAGADVEALRDHFGQTRDGGRRGHEAVDIMAPRHTPVHAVADGSIVKLFLSKQGGTTIYQFDPRGRYCFYYAHLERYADALREGQQVAAGDILGYVGTSGNAPPDAPHLHFAIFELTGDKRWWEGTPIDPYPAFAR